MDTPQNRVKAATAVKDIETEALEEPLKGLENKVYFMTLFPYLTPHHKPILFMFLFLVFI